MSSLRSAGTKRSLVFLNALLLSSALALPAMAQIEEVVVTAQKKAEDIQNVPIAVTAFTGGDLKTQQIAQVKDLQFHAPEVTYTAGNFGGVDFQIRGIGITAVGYDSESGVAINFDEVYLAAPQLTEGSFYDLQGLEVLAGPQSTLYGRGATGGAVNLNIIKPDLETPSAELVGTYGNYDTTKVEGAVNLPIVTDQLGLRIAGEWDRRDGFVTNIYDNGNVDGLNQYSVRPTLRWQPSERTTIDITGQFTSEDDTHMRADKQLCTTDPTGVLGCLPGSAGTGPENAYSNLSVIASSQQGLGNALGNAALGDELGLFNLSTPFLSLLPAGYNDPSGDRQINTTFTPIWRSQDNFLSLNWKQNVTHWLDSTLVLGYDRDSFYSQESYNNIPGLALPSNTNYTLVAPTLTENCAAALGLVPGGPNVQCAALAFQGLMGALGGPTYAAGFAPYFANAASGQLPISLIGNLGITGGNYAYTGANAAFDQSDGASSEYSGEWRLDTSFSGPLNARLGIYYLHTSTTGDYYVNAPTLDYPAIVLGGFTGLPYAGSFCATGCVLSPGYYHNYGQSTALTSKAVFGEITYKAIPDLLTFIGGMRFTDDQKTQNDRILLYSTLVPIGTTNENGGIPGTGANAYDSTKQDFQKITGHFTTQYTPKFDFTDQTQIYASYSRGYKAGGANPGIEASNNPFDLPLTYKPEFIDAYEVGTKNQLLNNTLQANGDVYYYDYYGLQVSAIQSNTSINQNINARAWGAEGKFLWQPSDRWQFGLSGAHEESNIVNTQLVDTRNPTGGNPNTLLIKDDTVSGTTGSNCVVYYSGAFPGLPAGFTAPAGGVHALSAYGIPNAAFGSCQPAGLAALTAAGYTYTAANLQGQAVSLNGNELQDTPNLSVSINGQYTQPLGGDYNLVARADAHWQSHFWQRIFEDGADHVGAEYTVDASLQLNAPDNVWYAQVYVKNIFNQNNITGGYLTSSTSGLYTNAFYGDPQTYGITLGAKLN